MVCLEEYKDFIEGKEAKKHPAAMVTERRALEKCAMKTYLGLKEHCGAEYEELDKCLKKNPKRYIKCRDLVKKMQRCAVINEIAAKHPEIRQQVKK